MEDYDVNVGMIWNEMNMDLVVLFRRGYWAPCHFVINGVAILKVRMIGALP